MTKLFSFPYKGQTVDVYHSDTGSHFEYTGAKGVRKVALAEAFQVRLQNTAWFPVEELGDYSLVHVPFKTCELYPDGSLNLRTLQEHYYEVREEELEKFKNLVFGTAPLKEILRIVLNGVMECIPELGGDAERSNGIFPFSASTLQPITPIDFSATKTDCTLADPGDPATVQNDGSIAVTVHSGGGDYRYALTGTEVTDKFSVSFRQMIDEFVYLSPGIYRLWVKSMTEDHISPYLDIEILAPATI
ncbi:hypothetical protein AAG747_14005 [Rapidithrix thailandica]|uniref:DUF4469 domain-containing protein n=1 Tax=Rapidithrix thailandica TaxID=413964 RepID=A0AAW9SCH2_9BACT